MNKFTADVRRVWDANIGGWTTDTWYPLPCPKGIVADILHDGYWLVRSPLPPLPEPPKTQEKLDDIAFFSWLKQTPAGFSPATSEIWHAALAWERAQREGRK